jgi:hypothetical protein
MSRKMRHPPEVTHLRPFEQTEVLTTLAGRDDAVGEAVRKEIERVLANVDPDGIAGEVQRNLEFIAVETIAARSGRHRCGYTEPEEAAWQVLEEALEPHLERMKWYHGVGQDDACDAYALGVLRGLYDFHHEGDAEWKQLSPDNAREMFGWVLNEWEDRRQGTTERRAMRDRLGSYCPRWERDFS